MLHFSEQAEPVTNAINVHSIECHFPTLFRTRLLTHQISNSAKCAVNLELRPKCCCSEVILTRFPGINSPWNDLRPSFPPAPKMLLLRSYPNSFFFIGSAFSYSESIKESVRTEVDPPIWNLERPVYHISRYANFNPHPHLMDGPNGVSLFCTSRGFAVAHVSGSKSISRGSSIQRRGGDCEADDDQNSKNSGDVKLA